MLKLIRENRLFLILSLIFWVVLLVMVVDLPKAKLHLLLNTYHNHILDFIFVNLTQIGGALPFIVGGCLLFYRFSDALLVLIPQILISLPLYVLKQLLDEPRPVIYFQKLHLMFPHVDGVSLCVTNSFPSGHTTAAFAMFLSLAMIVKNKVWLRVLFFMLAVGVAYSRVYLSQHFAGDVLGGSVIGVLFTMGYVYFHNRLHLDWMDLSFLKLKGKRLAILK